MRLTVNSILLPINQLQLILPEGYSLDIWNDHNHPVTIRIKDGDRIKYVLVIPDEDVKRYSSGGLSTLILEGVEKALEILKQEGYD